MTINRLKIKAFIKTLFIFCLIKDIELPFSIQEGNGVSFSPYPPAFFNILYYHPPSRCSDMPTIIAIKRASTKGGPSLQKFSGGFRALNSIKTLIKERRDVLWKKIFVFLILIRRLSLTKEGVWRKIFRMYFFK